MNLKSTFLSLLLTVGFCTFLTEDAKAQDPQFAQFYAAPLQLNPAMTGVHTGRFRFVTNYKQQWNSILGDDPFKTVSASYDMRYGIGRNDFLAFGVTALQDWAGSSNFKRVTGDLSIAYMKQLDGSRYRTYDQFLIGGAQVGVGQHSFDMSGLWFSTQFNGTTESIDFSITDPDPSLPSQMTDMYLNMNVGLMWYAVFDHNASIYIGGAAHHLNAPTASFIADNGDEIIPMRWVGQIGGEIPFNDQMSLLPAVMFTGQGPSMLGIFGFNLRYTNRDWREVAIRSGIWGHMAKDEVDNFSFPNYTVAAILELERLHIGISYDVNANKLSDPTNGRGGYELSLIYVHPGSRKEKVNCPKY